MASFINSSSKSMKRTAKLHGLESHVNIYITERGVEMAVVGHRKRIYATWEHIVKAMHTSVDVPSFLHDRPMEFLNHQAKQKGKSNVQPIDTKRLKPAVGVIAIPLGQPA